MLETFDMHVHSSIGKMITSQDTDSIRTDKITVVRNPIIDQEKMKPAGISQIVRYASNFLAIVTPSIYVCMYQYNLANLKNSSSLLLSTHWIVKFLQTYRVSNPVIHINKKLCYCCMADALCFLALRVQEVIWDLPRIMLEFSFDEAL